MQGFQSHLGPWVNLDCGASCGAAAAAIVVVVGGRSGGEESRSRGPLAVGRI